MSCTQSPLPTASPSAQSQFSVVFTESCHLSTLQIYIKFQTQAKGVRFHASTVLSMNRKLTFIMPLENNMSREGQMVVFINHTVLHSTCGVPVKERSVFIWLAFLYSQPASGVSPSFWKDPCPRRSHGKAGDSRVKDQTPESVTTQS